jgi:peptidoglycan hydrolase CwlO-like protein
VAALALGLALLVSPAGADTKTDLKNAQSKLDSLINQISAESHAIQGLEAKIAAKQGAIEAVRVQVEQTQARIVKLQSEIEAATYQLQATQRQLDRRAWVAYESGPGSNVEFLLTSTSLSDLSDRLQILNNAAESDQGLIDKITNQRAALSKKQEDAQKLKAELRDQQAGLQNQQDALQVQLTAAQAAYQRLSADKASAEKLVKKLKAQRQREIEAARLAAAQAAAAHSGSTEGAVGHPFHVCPVSGAGYGDDFGAPRYSGGFHPHAGNDMFAPLGTPIKAPFSGSASNSTNALGGLSVTVSGPDGYVYNAHLSAFGTLGSVSTGTVIGYVGNTGDAQGGAYHDHFEWHPAVIPAHPHVSPYGYSVIGDAIDPYPYLNQVC